MSLITRMRRQTALYWRRQETPDKFGRFTFDPPIEIKCRWEDTAQEFLTPTNERQVSRAVVYVDRVMSPGDRLMRGGTGEDLWILATGRWNDTGVWMDDERWIDTPGIVTDIEPGSFEIRRFDRNPNFRNTEELLTAFL